MALAPIQRQLFEIQAQKVVPQAGDTGRLSPWFDCSDEWPVAWLSVDSFVNMQLHLMCPPVIIPVGPGALSVILQATPLPMTVVRLPDLWPAVQCHAGDIVRGKWLKGNRVRPFP